MDKRGQDRDRGKGQPTPSSSRGEVTMTTRYRRKKEEEKTSRREERSKRLRLVDHQDGLNNDIVLTGPAGGAMGRVKLEPGGQQVKIERDSNSMEVATGSGQDTGHLPASQVVVKTESPGTLPSIEIVVKEEVDVPNDCDQEEESGRESNLLPEEAVADFDFVSDVESDFGIIQKENEELRKLLHKRDLEIKILKEEIERLKLSNSNNRHQVSTGEDEVASNLDSGERSTEASKASPTARIETLEIENKLRTLLPQKEAENMDPSKRTNHLESDIARGTGASMNMTLVTEEMKKARRKEVIESYLRSATETTRTSPLGTPEEKVLQLFPHIIKIIIKNEPRVTNSVHWRKLMPLVTACRRVCKSWKDSVDRIMEQDLAHFDLGRSYGTLAVQRQDFTPCPLRISYKWRCKAGCAVADKLEQIRCQLKVNPSYNPIPSRHLMLSGQRPAHLSSASSDKWTNYCQIVKSFLQQVGKQVWYLTVDFEGGGFPHPWLDLKVFYRTLSEWFSLLPNLRFLSLGALFLTLSAEDCRKALDKISFSKWEQLETLVVSSTRQSHLYYTILMNNSHVKRLSLSPRTAPSPVSMELDLPNLSTLKCKFYDAEDWEKFANSATWKIQHLSVEFIDFCGGASLPSAVQFAEGVAKFASTLTSLTFSPYEIGTCTGEDLELDLPQLKSLHLISGKLNVLPLERLLVSLKNLESFLLEISLFQRSHIDQTIFVDYLNNFCDKVDWMKLPKLRNVKICVKLNRRDIGERDVIVKRRTNMPSVIFSVPKINNN